MQSYRSQATAFFLGITVLSGCNSTPEEPEVIQTSYVPEDLPFELPNHNGDDISEAEKQAMRDAFDEAISLLTERRAPEPESEPLDLQIPVSP